MKNSESTSNNLFLLGAGFTKAVFPNAPLNKDLLPVLCKGTPRTTLKKYYREYKTDDIEILLTRLDLDILHPKAKQQTALQTVRKNIERKLAEYFQQFRFKEQLLELKPWLDSFVKLFKENDAIISLNYDCLLEGLLDFYKIWNPNGYVNVKNDLFDVPNPQNIHIYKIHGSENFWISPTLPAKNQEAIGLIIDATIFPFSGKNSHLRYGGGQEETRSYIIAPSFLKLPHVQIADMINKATKVAPYSKNMIIGGCSLRPEDPFIWLLITSFINKQLQIPKNLIIISPSATEIKNRIKNYWIGSNKHFNICSIPEKFQDGIDKLLEALNPR